MHSNSWEKKVVVNFFLSQTVNIFFCCWWNFFGGLRLNFFKHRCICAIYVSKNQVRNFFISRLVVLFFCFLARAFWASARSCKPSCQICILRDVSRSNLSNLLPEEKKHTIFSGSWAKFLKRFGKDIPDWCQKWILTVIENILSKTVFWYLFFWEVFESFLVFRRISEKRV